MTVEDNAFYDYWNSSEMVSIRNEYKNITNITMWEGIGLSFLPAYCDNMKIPLPPDLFDLVINTTYINEQLKWQNEYNMYNNDSKNSSSSTKNQTKHELWQLVSSPMRYIVYQHALNATAASGLSTSSNTNNNNIIYHSFHDSSILIFLAGLGISNGIPPIFAEILLIEIYEIKSEYDETYFPSGFGFRFIRNEDVLEFDHENCTKLINMGSQLCDLNVLLLYLNDKAMDQNEWEVYMQDYLNNVSSSSSSGGSNDSGDDDCKSNKKYTEKDMNSKFLEGIFVGVAIGTFGAIIVGVIYFCARKYGDKRTRTEYNAFDNAAAN